MLMGGIEGLEEAGPRANEQKPEAERTPSQGDILPRGSR